MHDVLVNRLVKLLPRKKCDSLDIAVAVDWDVLQQTKPKGLSTPLQLCDESYIRILYTYFMLHVPAIICSVMSGRLPELKPGPEVIKLFSCSRAQANTKKVF